MSNTEPLLPVENAGTAITRFNALRHGVLSRFTVLPWEDEQEYQALVSALVAEHAPQGPTEEHLVEELVGILWRKRRLRLAEPPPTGAGSTTPSTPTARRRRRRSPISPMSANLSGSPLLFARPTAIRRTTSGMWRMTRR